MFLLGLPRPGGAAVVPALLEDGADEAAEGRGSGRRPRVRGAPGGVRPLEGRLVRGEVKKLFEFLSVSCALLVLLLLLFLHSPRLLLWRLLSSRLACSALLRA